MLPDILKGLAVILMIQVHLVELFALPGVVDGITGRISLFLGGPPAAPVFLAVMGYFMARSGKECQSGLARGLRLLLWGFLLNLGMNAHLLVKIFSGGIQLNPWPYVFGVDILFLAGLSIILIAVFRQVFGHRIAPWLILIILLALPGSFLPAYTGDQPWVRYVLAFFWTNEPWSYFPFFPWATYAVIGVAIYLISQKFPFGEFTSKGLLYILTALLVIIAVSFGWGFRVSVTLNEYYHHSILYVLWVVVFMMFWTIAVHLATTGRHDTEVVCYLRWVGRNVTSFYVFQWLLIGNIGTAIYQTQNALALIGWFIVIVIGVSFLVVLWRRLKPRGLKE